MFSSAFVVVLQIADDNDDNDGAFSANHISATRGLLVALTNKFVFVSIHACSYGRATRTVRSFFLVSDFAFCRQRECGA